MASKPEGKVMKKVYPVIRSIGQASAIFSIGTALLLTVSCAGQALYAASYLGGSCGTPGTLAAIALEQDMPVQVVFPLASWAIVRRLGTAGPAVRCANILLITVWAFALLFLRVAPKWIH